MRPAFQPALAVRPRFAHGQHATCSRSPRMVVTTEFKKRAVQRVDPKTGWNSRDSGGENVVELLIDLAPQYIPALDLKTERAESAVVYALEDDVNSNFSRCPPTIVFLHGFSQRPVNYDSLLQLLAANGFVVVAPRVWLFDVALPWSHVEGAARPDERFVSAPAKLQTALLIDALRCVAWARDVVRTGKVSLLGHSMGGAMALVAAQKLGASTLKSVATMAPALGLMRTPVNELLSSLDGGDVPAFAEEFGDIPFFVLNGESDKIVKPASVENLFNTFLEKSSVQVLGHALLTRGSHTGFEDTVNVDVPILKLFDSLLFTIVDLFVFGFFDLFYDSDEQLVATKAMLLKWFRGTDVPTIDANELRASIGKVNEELKATKLTWRP